MYSRPLCRLFYRKEVREMAYRKGFGTVWKGVVLHYGVAYRRIQALHDDTNVGWGN